MVAYLKDGDITSHHANKYDDQNGNADKNHDLLLQKQKTAHISIIIIIIIMVKNAHKLNLWFT